MGRSGVEAGMEDKGGGAGRPTAQRSPAGRLPPPQTHRGSQQATTQDGTALGTGSLQPELELITVRFVAPPSICDTMSFFRPSAQNCKIFPSRSARTSLRRDLPSFSATPSEKSQNHLPRESNHHSHNGTSHRGAIRGFLKRHFVASLG